ncbi:MAG: hypothetical protein J6W29_09715 [Neisseriaceae bacterium]|nr:hypothetical protein [Neisseriaceae bacterium]MBR5941221.1 hypothetical protein [Neisseriaceae bacterium]
MSAPMVFRLPEKLLSLRAFATQRRSNLLATKNGIVKNRFRLPENIDF